VPGVSHNFVIEPTGGIHTKKKIVVTFEKGKPLPKTAKQGGGERPLLETEGRRRTACGHPHRRSATPPSSSLNVKRGPSQASSLFTTWALLERRSGSRRSVHRMCVRLFDYSVYVSLLLTHAAPRNERTPFDAGCKSRRVK
jgi:hypothetical protein